MATTKATELGQLGSKLTVHNENITLDGNVHGQYAGFDSDFTNALSSNISVTGNITVTGTVDGRDVATDGTKLDGIEAAATADQTKSDIEGLALMCQQLILQVQFQRHVYLQQQHKLRVTIVQRLLQQLM